MCRNRYNQERAVFGLGCRTPDELALSETTGVVASNGYRLVPTVSHSQPFGFVKPILSNPRSTSYVSPIEAIRT